MNGDVTVGGGTTTDVIVNSDHFNLNGVVYLSFNNEGEIPGFINSGILSTNGEIHIGIPFLNTANVSILGGLYCDYGYVQEGSGLTNLNDYTIGAAYFLFNGVKSRDREP